MKLKFLIRSFLIFIFVSIVLSSCTKIKIEYWENNKVKKIAKYINKDTLLIANYDDKGYIHSILKLKNKTKEGYLIWLWENGKFSRILKYFDKNTFESIDYWSNGLVFSKGKLKNAKKEGFWKEYYRDGKLRWEGEYVCGRRNYKKIDYNNLEMHLSIDFYEKRDTFIVGNEYLFRMYLSGIHPEDTKGGIYYNREDKYANINNLSVVFQFVNYDNFEFKVVFPKPGKIWFYAYPSFNPDARKSISFLVVEK